MDSSLACRGKPADQAERAGSRFQIGSNSGGGNLALGLKVHNSPVPGSDPLLSPVCCCLFQVHYCACFPLAEPLTLRIWSISSMALAVSTFSF